jgi:hypothetical protein
MRAATCTHRPPDTREKVHAHGAVSETATQGHHMLNSTTLPLHFSSRFLLQVDAKLDEVRVCVWRARVYVWPSVRWRGGRVCVWPSVRWSGVRVVADVIWSHGEPNPNPNVDTRRGWKRTHLWR